MKVGRKVVVRSDCLAVVRSGGRAVLRSLSGRVGGLGVGGDGTQSACGGRG